MEGQHIKRTLNRQKTCRYAAYVCKQTRLICGHNPPASHWQSSLLSTTDYYLKQPTNQKTITPSQGFLYMCEYPFH